MGFIVTPPSLLSLQLVVDYPAGVTPAQRILLPSKQDRHGVGPHLVYDSLLRACGLTDILPSGRELAVAYCLGTK